MNLGIAKMDDQVDPHVSGDRRRWRMLFFFLFTVGVILLGLTVFFRFSSQEELLPVPLQSEETADYSSDPRFRVPVIRRQAIEGALGDQPPEMPDELSTVISNLETPVPTVTPLAFLTPSVPPPPQSTQPFIFPSATSTVIPTSIISPTPPPSSPTAIEATPTIPSSTPGPSPSFDPSVTPFPSPSSTVITVSPTPTSASNFTPTLPPYPPPPTPTPTSPPPTPYP